MEEENRLKCLTEKQRKVYTLWQGGMTKTNVAKELNLSYSGVNQLIKNAERRLRQYDRAMEVREQNKQPIDLPLTRADGLILYEALNDYVNKLERIPQPNVKTDWLGRAPYEILLAADVYDRLQFALFGKKMGSAILGWESPWSVDKETENGDNSDKE